MGVASQIAWDGTVALCKGQQWDARKRRCVEMFPSLPSITAAVLGRNSKSRPVLNKLK